MFSFEGVARCRFRRPLADAAGQCGFPRQPRWLSP